MSEDKMCTALRDACQQMMEYVDKYQIKSFIHQVARGGVSLNQEFHLTRRGFNFYAGFNYFVPHVKLTASFDDNSSNRWIEPVADLEDVGEAKRKLLVKIREYMIKHSIFNHRLED